MKQGLKIVLITGAVVGFGAVAPVVNARLERGLRSSTAKVKPVVKENVAQKKVTEAENKKINPATNQSAAPVVTNSKPVAKQVSCNSERIIEPEEKDYSIHYDSSCASDQPPKINYKDNGLVVTCSDGSRTVITRGWGSKTICTGPTRAQLVDKRRQELVNEYNEKVVARCFNPNIGTYGDLSHECMRQGFIEAYGYAPEDRPQSSSSVSQQQACYNSCMSVASGVNGSAVFNIASACQSKCRR